MNQIEHALEQAHTVKNLIDKLQQFDPDARVLFVCDYGDRHHTQQALPVAEIDEYDSDLLVESGYSHSGVAFTEDDEAGDAAEDSQIIVILSE